MVQKIWRTTPARQTVFKPLAPVPQHSNATANERRAVKAVLGARQERKQRKSLARAAKGL